MYCDLFWFAEFVVWFSCLLVLVGFDFGGYFYV